MHELSIARDIVRRALDEAAEGDSSIESMSIVLGKGEHFSKDALAFGIEAVSQGTAAEGARVHIEYSADEGIMLESIELKELA